MVVVRFHAIGQPDGVNTRVALDMLSQLENRSNGRLELLSTFGDDELDRDDELAGQKPVSQRIPVTNLMHRRTLFGGQGLKTWLWIMYSIRKHASTMYLS